MLSKQPKAAFALPAASCYEFVTQRRRTAGICFIDARVHSPTGVGPLAAVTLDERRLGKEGLSTRQRDQVRYRHPRDLGQSLVREKGLMCGDQYIRKGEQARELVVLQDPAGEVLEENAL